MDGRLLVEIKCVEHLSNEHLAQCINYLRASGLHLALLINFRKSRVEWRRVVHDLQSDSCSCRFIRGYQTMTGREASAARAASLCAGHVQQLGGESPPANLMEVKA